MYSSKLIKSLSRLDKKEFLRFEKYVVQHNIHADSGLVRLLRCIKNFYPEFNSEKLSKQEVYHKLFSNPASQGEKELRSQNKKYVN